MNQLKRARKRVLKANQLTADEQLAKWFAQCRQAKKMKEGEYLSDTELLAWMAKHKSSM